MRRRGDIGRVSGARCHRRRTRARNSRTASGQQDAFARSELSGRYESTGRNECHVRPGYCASRERCFSKPKRSVAYRHPRLEFAGRSRVQRDRFHRFDARYRLGRSDRVFWRRSRNAEHSLVHGIRRGRPLVPLSSARSCPPQTNHRDQSRPFGSSLEGREFPHRRADGKRRRV